MPSSAVLPLTARTVTQLLCQPLRLEYNGPTSSSPQSDEVRPGPVPTATRSRIQLSTPTAGRGSRAVRRIPPMIVFIRAGLFAALVTLASIFSASVSFAADKAFERPELAEAAIKLEAQIKGEAGTAQRPLAQ